MRTEDGIDRPVALVIDIIARQDRRLTGHGFWQIRGHACHCVRSSDSLRLVVRPVLYVGKKELAAWIYESTTLLVCGLPKLARKMVQPNHPNLNPRLDITFEVYSLTQLCAYNSTQTDQDY
jgi:hypothetical protein